MRVPDAADSYPAAVRPLDGVTVVDLSRHLPGPFASRELLEQGARVIRLLPPGGDPMADLAPAWHEAINAGKEIVLLDLKTEPEQGRALCADADVVLESFRPGVVERLGVGPDDLPESVVYCSLTGFGSGGRHVNRAGHDLNYLGWAGVLADTAPALPPTQIADLAGGALTAVTRILAALLQRERTGRGARIVVSMTHGAHRLVSHRLGGEPIPRLLTGGLACYGIYATADGRHLTVAALEGHFFARLCQLLELSDLTDRHFDPDAQEEIGDALAERIASKPLAAWLELFDGEDVSVGPVATIEEAAAELA
jgi:crotonobetainyl-CoA:carnitine CoA-transferase CaiB-like acyl-CoA transferase